METDRSRQTAITIIVLIVVTLLIIGAVVFANQNNNGQNTATLKTSKIASTPENKSDKSGSDSAGTYKDGTYNAKGEYQSPGGSQEIKVSVTLSSDGTITDTSAEGDDKSTDSRFYQSSFISNYKNEVVGKKIDEVKLDHVGASSLTSQGFNDALEEIKNQAKA